MCSSAPVAGRKSLGGTRSLIAMGGGCGKQAHVPSAPRRSLNGRRPSLLNGQRRSPWSDRTPGASEPVLINYSVGARGRSPRFEKSPDERDRDILRRIEASPLPTGITTRRMPDGDEGRRNDPVGWTHVHHFFTPRALRVFGAIEARCHAPTTRAALYGGYSVGLRLSRFLAPQWFAKTTGPMKPSTSGTLYAPSLSGEQNWLNIFESRVAAVGRGAAEGIRAGQAALSTSSMTVPQVPVESVDYIFLDPPFGSNSATPI